jgi:NAD(P)-dependent dehydrogenase (short-subunit alcohol dehydrogenase family)
MSAPVVFITGAGRGVGCAIARRFAAGGYGVAAAGRALAPLEELARDLVRAGVPTAIVPCDVTDAGQVQRAVADAERQLGPIDVLVNNAGASDSAPFASMDDELWDRMLAVNLTGAYRVMRAVVPGMFERDRGRVINIASSAGKRGFPYTAAYVAAKHGLVGLTRAVAIEAAPHGVTVNAVCPGWIDTPMTETSITRIVEKTGRTAAEARRALERMNPQGRLIQPEEVAALALFLASPDAHGINGQALDL